MLETIRMLQEDADYINEWQVNNGLSLNVEKTKAILIGSKDLFNSHSYIPYPISIDNLFSSTHVSETLG